MLKLSQILSYGLVLLLTSSVSSLAQAAAPGLPNSLTEKLRIVETEGFSSWPAVWLEESDKISICGSKTIESYKLGLLVNNPTSVDDEGLGEWKFSYYPERPIRIVSAQLLRDGVALQPLNVFHRDANSDYLVYDGKSEMVVSWPGLQAGDIISVSVEFPLDNAVDDDGMGVCAFYSLRDSLHFGERVVSGVSAFPIIQRTVIVESGDGKPITHRTVGPQDTMVVQETENALTWSGGPILPLPRESNTPEEYTHSGLEISTIETWSQVAEAYRENQAVETSEDLSRIVEQLKPSSKSDELSVGEKYRLAWKIICWVKNNIRYRSSSVATQKCETTLANRVGDCDDMARLTVAMCHEAGLPAQIAHLMSPGGDCPDISQDIPVFFNHAIVRVGDPGEDAWFWTDLTEKTVPDALSCAGRTALVVYDNMHSLETVGEIPSMTYSSCSLEPVRQGLLVIEDVQESGVFADQRIRQARASSGDSLDAFRNATIFSAYGQLPEQIEATDPWALNSAISTQSTGVLRLDQPSDAICKVFVEESWLTRLGKIDDDRKLPFSLDAVHIWTAYQIKCPAYLGDASDIAVKVDRTLLEELEFEAVGIGSFSRRAIRKVGNEFIIEWHIKTCDTVLAQEDFDRYREFMNAVEAATKAWIIFESKTD